MYKGKKIAVLIPALNEEKTIAKVIILAKEYADSIIVCDDGSSDMTGIIAKELGAKIIKHDLNMGKGASLRDLINAVEDADIVVTIDADMQHDPRNIPMLIDTLLEYDADIVIASRFLDERYAKLPGYRMIGNKILNFVMGKAVSDSQSGFRAMKLKVAKDIIPSEMGFGAESEMIFKAIDKGYKIIEIPAYIRYDVDNPSKKNPIYHGLDILASILKFYVIRHPLLTFGIPAFIFGVIALISGFLAIEFYNRTRILSTNLLIISGISLLLFAILATSAVLLFILITVVREKK
jgi:glycosyltransferase involved in cell wall biosynthesis